MARRTTVVLLDDLDASTADESVEFGLDGATYEIDLTHSHARALRDELTPYIAHARRTDGHRARGPTPPTNPRTAPAPATAAPAAARTVAAQRVGPDGLTGDERERIRAWANDEGIEVKARGRLTQDLIANHPAVQARR